MSENILQRFLNYQYANNTGKIVQKYIILHCHITNAGSLVLYCWTQLAKCTEVNGYNNLCFLNTLLHRKEKKFWEFGKIFRNYRKFKKTTDSTPNEDFLNTRILKYTQ